MAQGKLIAIEGIDGAGTTTQAHRLVSWIEAQGQRARFTCEPSDGPVGTLIRQALRGQLERRLDPAAVALLFAADRVDHVRAEIAPQLEAGCCVITDRYVYSSLAYQSLFEELSWVQHINRLAPPPDLLIYVRVDPDVACARRAVRGQAEELFEAQELQRRISARYDALFGLTPSAGASAGPRRAQAPLRLEAGAPSSPSGVGHIPDPAGSFARVPFAVVDGAARIEDIHDQMTRLVQPLMTTAPDQETRSR